MTDTLPNLTNAEKMAASQQEPEEAFMQTISNSVGAANKPQFHAKVKQTLGTITWHI